MHVAPRLPRAYTLLCALACVTGTSRARAQTSSASPTQTAPAGVDARLRSGRDELARARDQRAALEAQLRTLQDTVHDLRAETAMFDRRAEATARLVGALDRQLSAIHGEVEATTARYDSASHDLARQQIGLRRRLVDIYKRGPVAEAEALLSAASFGDLVARYKYLHELARRDRTLVRRVERTRNEVAAQRALLVRLQIELALNRDEKAAEEARLRRIETERGQSLAQVEGRATRTRDRIARIARDEARLSSLLAEIEAARRRRELAARLAAERAAAARVAAAREAARKEAARVAARNAAARTNGRRTEVAVAPPPLATVAPTPDSDAHPRARRDRADQLHLAASRSPPLSLRARHRGEQYGHSLERRRYQRGRGHTGARGGCRARRGRAEHRLVRADGHPAARGRRLQRVRLARARRRAGRGRGATRAGDRLGRRG